MRIAAGKLKNRKIEIPEGLAIRPTSDKARQAMFNILAHGKPAQHMGAILPVASNVLDVFCGSGALGLEAISRGAEYACFIDQDIKMARHNATAMGVMGDCDFVASTIDHLQTARQKFDLIFMDPPYGKDLIVPSVAMLEQVGWIADRAVLAIECGKAEDYNLPDHYILLDERLYGAAKVRFYGK